MDLLDRLLGHDAWTTRRLLELAAPLDDVQLDHAFDIGHRTVRRTFAHIIGNIECWTDLMAGRAVCPGPGPDQSIPALTQRHTAAAANLLQLGRRIVGEQRLDETYVDALDNPPTEKSYGGTIVHLATHGMHHRAQLLYMLRRLGVADLPEGDALSWERQQHSRPDCTTGR